MRCRLCQERIPNFQGPLLLCPVCGSRPEERLEALFLPKIDFGKDAKILVLHPSAAKVKYLLREESLRYSRLTFVDRDQQEYESLVKTPHRAMPLDLTHLIFPDQCFDFILGGGILPFVRSDYLAMSEMHRCLRADGMTVLSIGALGAKTRRASEVSGSDPRLEWLYGEDFLERLEAAGFFFHRLSAKLVEPERLSENGISEAAELILCFKFRDRREKFLEGIGANG
jgi:hypothetical protein